ncbi:MAG: glycoside hydrolase family 3 protein [Alphaproteobacteria bacterium]|nr:glycoside hydrolase family 3 protein [Alphaproteobacteria bacterium]
MLVAATALLGACSSSSQISGLLGGAPAPAAQPAVVAPVVPSAPSIDFGTSTDIHPQLWPQGASGVARDPAIEAEVSRLLSQMTVEEKVGQIIQADLNAVTPDQVRQYHIGSILVGGDDGPGNNDRALPPVWLKTADEYYDASVNVAPGRPVIPIIWGIDAVHGNNNLIGATLFPQNIGLGAMRDPDLMRKIGEVTAQEVRITGQDWTFAPCLTVPRDDRWGRTYEGYSEDPRIVADYAGAIVEGLQGVPGAPDFLKGGHIIATAKHFLGDGGTDKGRDQGDTLYSEEALRDIFAPPYEAAIKAGVQSVIVSYSSWRGQKMHGNKALLTDVLVGRLGFDGFAIGDWNGHAQVPGCSLVDCPIAVNAGLDMFMISHDWQALYTNTLAEVKAGTIPMARLDEAVSRILRVKLRAGVMTEGRPSSRPYAGRWDLLGSIPHREVARQAVRESLVLLKNDGGLLPLSPRAHILVAGSGTDDISMQTGGWTISWKGNGNTRADFPHASTIYEGIKAEVAAAGGTATLSPDGSFTDRPDVAIVIFGEQPYAEGSGDISDLDFSGRDAQNLALLRHLKAQGIPVVSIFLSGRPLYVTPEVNASNAFVAAWLPGSEGEGVSDVLFSRADGSVAYDFRGKLSYSWPRAPDQTPLNVGTEPYYPLFSYGYGLTYGAPRNIGALPEAAAVVTSRTYDVTPQPQQPPVRERPELRTKPVHAAVTRAKPVHAAVSSHHRRVVKPVVKHKTRARKVKGKPRHHAR